MKNVIKAVEVSAAGLAVAGALTLGIAYGFVCGLVRDDPDASGFTSNDEEEG